MFRQFPNISSSRTSRRSSPGLLGTYNITAQSPIQTVLADAQLQTIEGYIKVWDGTQWVKKPVKYWTGAAWVQKPIRVWNGLNWIFTR